LSLEVDLDSRNQPEKRIIEVNSRSYSSSCSAGFHLGFLSRGGKHDNCRIKRGRGYFKCFFISKVLVNLGGLGVLPLENFVFSASETVSGGF
jgi:hypothetical protein